MVPGTVNGKGRPSPGASRGWDSLTPGLSQWILEAVASTGFSRMTPVQASTIPLFLGNKDVVVEAVTGSGKTLAFLVPVVEKLLRLEEPLKKHHVGAIVVSPTRELAHQIHTVLLSLLAFHAPSAASLELQRKSTIVSDTGDEVPADEAAAEVFPPSVLKVIPQLLVGGTTTPAQDLSSFVQNCPNVLISTPGRLLELLSSPHVHCPQSSFEVLVMDEADRLLDLGFKPDLQRILQRLPKQRRTGLFSASVTEAVDQIVRVGLRNPVRIAVKVRNKSGVPEQRTPASLQLSYVVTPSTHRIPALAKLLRTLSSVAQKTIVYLSTCAAVDYFQHVLPPLLSGFAIVPLHGKYPPQVRTKNFNRFTASVAPTLLLTTDVAARGLDIPSVDLVVQFDPPSDPKVFLHRCGRAGRAGRRGLAVTFLQPGREEDYVHFLSVRQTPIAPLTVPSVLVTASEAEETARQIRELVLQDRAIHDKGQRAFVSWVQAYSKHVASSIFRVADLDWLELGNAWGLLRLPKMPELKKWDGDRSLGLGIEFGQYAYKDKARENHRKEQYEARKTATLGSRSEAGAAEGKSKESRRKERAWTDKKAQKQTKEERRDRKQNRREKQRTAEMTEAEKSEHEELQSMIEEVRKGAAVEDNEEFRGFDD